MSRRSFGAVQRQRSGRWRASYTGPDGHRHSGPVTWTHRTDAEAWLAAERRILESGDWTPPADRSCAETAAGQLLADYAIAAIQRRATRTRNPLRPSTQAHYEQLLHHSILPALGDLPIASITPADITAWHDGLAASPTARGHAYSLLRSILAEAVDDDLLPRNPCRIRGGGAPAVAREAEVLTAPELAAYLDAVEPRYRVPLALAAWCSLRSGEVRALRRCDIADDAAVLHVRQAVTRIPHPDGAYWHFGPPKTRAGRRSVAIPPVLAAGLAGWLADWDERHPDRSTEGLLFTAQDGSSPLHDNTLRKAHRRAAAAVGRASLTVHDLRRTGATLAAQSGATVREVMRRLGHTRPAVAMLYQVADDARDAAVAARMSSLALPRREEHSEG